MSNARTFQVVDRPPPRRGVRHVQLSPLNEAILQTAVSGQAVCLSVEPEEAHRVQASLTANHGTFRRRGFKIRTSMAQDQRAVFTWLEPLEKDSQALNATPEPVR